MRARDIMTRNVITVSPDTRVADIAQLLAEKAVSGVPVVDGGKLVGVVSEGDLVRRSEIGTDRRTGSWWLRLFRSDTPFDFVKTHGRSARDIMTSPAVTVGEDAPLSEIADIFESKRIKRVPVVSGGKLVGIISRANLVRAIASAGEKAVAPAKPTDREIRDKLIGTLEAQGWWNKYVATINVSDGVVHYWGIAGGEGDRRAARIAAEGIPGVKAVQDHRVNYGMLPID
jgi:CBS domain-containing protein